MLTGFVRVISSSLTPVYVGRQALGSATVCFACVSTRCSLTLALYTCVCCACVVLVVYKGERWENCERAAASARAFAEVAYQHSQRVLELGAAAVARLDECRFGARSNAKRVLQLAAQLAASP